MAGRLDQEPSAEVRDTGDLEPAEDSCALGQIRYRL